MADPAPVLIQSLPGYTDAVLAASKMLREGWEQTTAMEQVVVELLAAEWRPPGNPRVRGCEQAWRPSADAEEMERLRGVEAESAAIGEAMVREGFEGVTVFELTGMLGLMKRSHNRMADLLMQMRANGERVEKVRQVLVDRQCGDMDPAAAIEVIEGILSQHPPGHVGVARSAAAAGEPVEVKRSGAYEVGRAFGGVLAGRPSITDPPARVNVGEVAEGQAFGGPPPPDCGMTMDEAGLPHAVVTDHEAFERDRRRDAGKRRGGG